MSELTPEKIKEMMMSLPRREPDLFNPFPMQRFAGLKVFEEPPPPAKIQVQQIFLKDGTPLLPPKFLAKENAWWAAEFGRREPFCKDRMYMLGSYGILMSAQHRHMITSIVS